MVTHPMHHPIDQDNEEALRAISQPAPETEDGPSLWERLKLWFKQAYTSICRWSQRAAWALTILSWVFLLSFQNFVKQLDSRLVLRLDRGAKVCSPPFVWIDGASCAEAVRDANLPLSASEVPDGTTSYALAVASRKLDSDKAADAGFKVNTKSDLDPVVSYENQDKAYAESQAQKAIPAKPFYTGVQK